MKALTIFAIIGVMLSTHAFAGYKLLGKTKQCPIKLSVYKEMAQNEGHLLVLHGDDLYVLAFEHEELGVSFYNSIPDDNAEGKYLTFKATIMRPEMARRSELKIYLSGAIVDCMIF